MLNLSEEQQEQAVPEGWRIEDLEGADWALSRVADLEREIAENEALAEAAIARIKLRTQALNEKAQRGVEFFESRLRAYAETHRAELLGGGKKKSRTLLHGSIGWRKVGGRLEVKDPGALLEWARSQPRETEVLRITEKPALDEIGRHFKRTGEVPSGCEVSPETDEVVIKTGDGT